MTMNLNQSDNIIQIELKFQILESRKEENENDKNQVYSIAVTKKPVKKAIASGIIEFILKDELIYLCESLNELLEDISSADRLNLNKEMARIGRQLYNELPLYVRECIEESYQYAQKQEKLLSVKLDLTEAEELMTVPWELLFHEYSDSHFTLSTKTSLTRVITTPVMLTKNKALNEKRLRMLIVVIPSRKEDAFFLPKELESIKKALKPLTTKREIDIEILNGIVTFYDFRLHLRNHNEYDIIHFIAHGGADGLNCPSLIFNSEPKLDGKAHDEYSIEDVAQMESASPVAAPDLKIVLEGLPKLKLVFFNSCSTGKISTEESKFLVSLAVGLVKQGIPSVIALQADVTQATSIRFAEELYAVLAVGHPLEFAISEARRTIYLESNEDRDLIGQWFLPVHYQAVSKVYETPPWFDRASHNAHDLVIQSAKNRDFVGTVAFSAYIFCSVLLLYPLFGNLAQALPTNAFTSDFKTLSPFSEMWNYLFLTKFLPLTFSFLFIILVACILAYQNNIWAGTFGKVDTSDARRYVFKISYIGANLGFVVGLCACYMFVAIPFYYTGLGDRLPAVLQDLLKITGAVIYSICILWFAHRLPVSDYSSITKLEDARIHKLTWLCSLIPILIVYFLLLINPAIIFNKPWGSIFMLVVLIGLGVYENRKNTRSRKN